MTVTLVWPGNPSLLRAIDETRGFRLTKLDRGRLNSRMNGRRPGADRSPRPTHGTGTVGTVQYYSSTRYRGTQ